MHADTSVPQRDHDRGCAQWVRPPVVRGIQVEYLPAALLWIAGFITARFDRWRDMAQFTCENNFGLRFATGRSGNSRGRPRKVARIRRDVAVALMPHGATLTRLAVQRALAGDAGCLAACVNLLGVVDAKDAGDDSQG